MPRITALMDSLSPPPAVKNAAVSVIANKAIQTMIKQYVSFCSYASLLHLIIICSLSAPTEI